MRDNTPTPVSACAACGYAALPWRMTTTCPCCREPFIPHEVANLAEGFLIVGTAAGADPFVGVYELRRKRGAA